MKIATLLERCCFFNQSEFGRQHDIEAIGDTFVEYFAIGRFER